MTRHERAELVTVIRLEGLPTLSVHADREQVQGWLATVDPNGCYSDADTDAEGWPRMTLHDAWCCVRDVLEYI